jgi:hypothetical protein
MVTGSAVAVPPAAPSNVIQVSPRSSVTVTPNVGNSGLTGLTVEVGLDNITVPLETVQVDELCHQLAIATPIPYRPTPAEAIDPAPGTFTVTPLPDEQPGLVVSAGRTQVLAEPEGGRTRLTIRHAGAAHSVNLPTAVAEQLLDQMRRRLIHDAWQATLGRLDVEGR